MLFDGRAGRWPHLGDPGAKQKATRIAADGRPDRILVPEGPRVKPADAISGGRLASGGRLRRSAMNWSNSRLVLGVPQAIEELAELALLLFEAAQRLGAVLVEGAVAAGTRVPHHSPPPGLIFPRMRSIFSCMRSILRCQRSTPW